MADSQLTPVPSSKTDAPPLVHEGLAINHTIDKSNDTIKSRNTDNETPFSFPMAPLTPASAAALARLRTYIPPPSIYPTLPLSRRAAVLLLLFADSLGNLRVLLTLRASNMTSYSGQVALPGGKADSLAETAFETARREAEEEVGLPRDALPKPWRVEHLCELEAQLAITEQAVRPCVAFLHHGGDSGGVGGVEGEGKGKAEEELIPKLNATEVAAVFSAPFHRFVSSRLEEEPARESPIRYEGHWQTWHGTRWRMHNFWIPKGQVNGSTSSSSASRSGVTSAASGERIDKENSYRVWGLTARMLIDSARIAYGRDPDFECLPEIGEEKLLARLVRRGKMSGERERGSLMPRGQVEKEKSESGKDGSESSSSQSGGEKGKL